MCPEDVPHALYDFIEPFFSVHGVFLSPFQMSFPVSELYIADPRSIASSTIMHSINLAPRQEAQGQGEQDYGRPRDNELTFFGHGVFLSPSSLLDRQAESQ
jgi:hypothetical protein